MGAVASVATSAARAQIGICMLDPRVFVFARESMRLSRCGFRSRLRMAEKSLEDKTIDESLREQVELIDRLLEAKLRPLRQDVAIIKHAVGVILTRT
jgi:hypothetical protein